jgi:hypothetical protein
MKMNGTDGETILCIAFSNTGHRFLKELADLDCQVVVLTIEEHRQAEWPLEAVSEMRTMPDGMTVQQITNTVTYLARSRKFSRVIPLDRFSVEIAAALREHLRIPGMGVTTARYFSDTLAARVKAAHMEIRVPAFTSIANYDELRSFMHAVPAPWLLTPRNETRVSVTQKLHESEQVWHALDALGDSQSDYLLEQSIEGDRFHVDSITADGTVVFSAVSPYLGPSSAATHTGELLSTVHAPCNAADSEGIRRVNTALLSSMGMARGVTHTEFLRSNATRDFYFMRTSASVDDSCIADMMHETRGLNLWVEWARLEVAAMRGQPYALPSTGNHRKALAASNDVQHRLA